ncbi:MAG: hypothetical protein ABSA33_05010, partial [Candidatus Micrarchaeaceae archaeon]
MEIEVTRIRTRGGDLELRSIPSSPDKLWLGVLGVEERNKPYPINMTELDRKDVLGLKRRLEKFLREEAKWQR